MYKYLLPLLVIAAACSEDVPNENEKNNSSSIQVENGIWDLDFTDATYEGDCSFDAGELTEELIPIAIETFGTKGIKIDMYGDIILLGERGSGGFWAAGEMDDDSIICIGTETTDGGVGDEGEEGEEGVDVPPSEEEVEVEVEEEENTDDWDDSEFCDSQEGLERTYSIQAFINGAEEISGAFNLNENQLDAEGEILSNCTVNVQFTGLLTDREDLYELSSPNTETPTEPPADEEVAEEVEEEEE